MFKWFKTKLAKTLVSEELKLEVAIQMRKELIADMATKQKTNKANKRTQKKTAKKTPTQTRAGYTINWLKAETGRKDYYFAGFTWKQGTRYATKCAVFPWNGQTRLFMANSNKATQAQVKAKCKEICKTLGKKYKVGKLERKSPSSSFIIITTLTATPRKTIKQKLKELFIMPDVYPSEIKSSSDKRCEEVI